MLERFTFRSRRGNLALAVSGVAYVVVAVVVLIFYIFDSWEGATRLDRLLQIVLMMSGLAGLLLAAVGAQNLRLTPQRQH
jgi:hypothetical protein